MDKENLLSIQDAARKLKVSTKTLRRWEGRGILVPLRTDGNHRRYSKSQIDSFWQRIHETKKEEAPKSIEIVNAYQPLNITKTIVENNNKPEATNLEYRLGGTVSRRRLILFPAIGGFLCLIMISVIAVVVNPFDSKKDSSPGFGEDVLGISVGKSRFAFRVNVPSFFSQDVEFLKGVEITNIATTAGGIDTRNSDVNAGTGSVFASNLIYGLVAGTGIAIGPGQNPTVTNTGVLSIGGATGAVALSAGTGISISGNTITNLAPDTIADAFKNIVIGSNTIVASGLDTVTITAGAGISVEGDPTSKSFTITSTPTLQVTSGFLHPGNTTLDLGIGGTSTAAAKFAFINVNSGVPTASISGNSGNIATTLSGLGVLGTTNGQSLSIGNSTTGNIILSGRNGANNGIQFSGYGAGIIHSNSAGVLTSSAVDLGAGVTEITGFLPTANGGLGASVTAAGAGEILYSASTTTYGHLAAGNSGQVLISNGAGAPGWVDATTVGVNYWQVSNGAISPVSSNLDLLVGSNATASSKFAFINVSGGTPTASISANSGNIATYLTGLGNLQTTNGQTLTLGGSTTGNIVIDSGSSSISLSDNTDITGNLDVSGTLTSGTTNAFTVDATGNISTSGTTGLTFTSTGGLVLAGGTISDGTDGVDIADALEVSGLITANGGLTVPSGQATTFASFTSDGGIFYGNATGILAQTAAGTNTQCLLGGTVPAFGSCATGVSQSNWRITNGALSPINNTLDVLIGSDATASSKFAFLNVSGGTPTASISSGTQGLILRGDGVIQSVRNNTLTLGGDTTGNIVIAPNNGGAGSLLTVNSLLMTLAGTTTLTGTSLTSITGGATAIDFTEFDVAAATGSITINDGGDLGQVSVEGSILDIDSLTFVGAGSILSGGGLGLTLDSASNTLTFAASDTTLTASGLATVTLGTSATINAGATALNLQTDGAIDVNIAGGSGATGCTIANSTGDLTCSGNILGSSTGTQGYWQRNLGALAPTNITDDLLLGSTSTTSAKFAFLNNAGGTPTASISANSGNIATYLTGDGTLATTNRQTLTIGNSATYNTTGNVLINPNGTGNVGIGTATPSRQLTINNTSNSYLGFSVGGTLQSTIGSDSIGDFFIYDDTSNSYRAVVNDSGNFGIGVHVTDPTSQLYVTRSLSFGANGKALAIFDQIENQDIFTASFSGTPKFTISNTGALTSAAYTNAGGILYTATTGLIGQTAIGTASQCLLGGTTPVFGSCATGPDQYWNSTLGAIYPNNSTLDLLVGGQSTASAKFAVLNVNGSGPVTATVSGNLIVMPTNGAGGKVGIGTINPSTTLEVAGGTSFFTYAGTDANGIDDTTMYLKSTEPVIGFLDTGSGNTSGFRLEGSSTGSFLMSTQTESAARVIRATFSSLGLIGFGTSSPTSELHVTRPLSFGVTGKALAIFDQIENQDIFTASASGVSKFTISNTGALTDAAYTNAGGLLYTSTTGLIGQTAIGTVSQCLLGGTVPAFGSCATGVSQSNWRITGGALSPINNTLDVLIGSDATASSKFAFLNVSGGTPTASISGNSGNIATYLTGLGNLQTTNGQTLTLGGNTTGDININPSNSDGIVRVNDYLDVARNASFGSDGAAIPDTTNAKTINLQANYTGTSDAFGVWSYRYQYNATNANSVSGVYGKAGFYKDDGSANSLAWARGITGIVDVPSPDGVGVPTITNAAALYALTNTDTGAGVIINNYGLYVEDQTVGTTLDYGIYIAGGDTFALHVASDDVSFMDDFLVGATTESIADAGFSLGGDDAYIEGDLGVNGTIYLDGGLSAGATVGTSSQCFLGGTTASWGSCTAGTSGAFWSQTNGALYPNNSTVDLLIGGTSTASADFAVLNVNGSGPATATVSGNLIVMPNNGAGGNVGIGTTTPGAKLEIGDGTATATVSAVIRGGLNTTDADAVLKLLEGNTTAGFQLQYQGDNNRFSILSDNNGGSINERLVIERDSGNVGIGTTTPSTVNGLDLSAQKVLNITGSGITRVSVSGSSGAGLDVIDSAAGANVKWGNFNSGGGVFTMRGLTDAGGVAFNFLAGNLTNGTLGVGTLAPASQLYVTRPLSYGATGKALVIFDQIENQDIFTASAGGVTKFTISNTGALTSAAYTNAGGILYTATTGLIGQTAIGTSSQCFLGGTIPSWGSCDAGTSGSFWSQTNGALYPNNSTVDLLIGGQSTVSAKFGFLNVNTGTPTASISGNSGDIALSISGLGAIQTTNAQSLTLNGNGFGNVGVGTATPSEKLTVSGRIQTEGSVGALVIKPRDGSGSDFSFYNPTGDNIQLDVSALGTAFTVNSSGRVGIGTTAPISELHVTRPVNSLFAATGKALAIFDQIENQDIFTASKSGTTMFTVNSNGNLQFKGSTAFTTTLTSATGNDVTLTIPDTGTTDSLCLLTLSNCFSGATTNYWQLNSNALSPSNSTYDLLVGSTATTSAKFAVLNMAGNAIPVATVSGNLIVMANSGTGVAGGGNVGIGTTAPTAGFKLDVNGSALVRGTNGGPGLSINNGFIQNMIGINHYSSVWYAYNIEGNGTNYITGGDVGQGIIGELGKLHLIYAAANQSQAAATFITNYAKITFDVANGNVTMVGTCTSQGADCAVDYAEYYPASELVDKAEIVVADGNNKENVKKSSSSYQLGIIGISSTDPGFLLSDKGAKVGNGQAYNPMKPNIALAGRVPVKVSTENGPIAIGDPLTSSSTPGVAMKATRAGQVVGKALEGYPSAGSGQAGGVGKILTFVNVSWYDPDVYLTNSGDISVLFDPATELGIVTNKGKQVDRVSSFKESVVGKLRAGIIEATTITVNSLNIKTEEVYIGDRTLAQYIADNTEQSGTFAADTELAEQVADLQNQVSSISAVLGVATESAELQALQDSIAQKEQEIAALQQSASASASLSKDLVTTKKLRVTGSALIEGIVTVLDNLTVQDLIVSGTSNFLGEVVFKDRVRFDSQVLFAKDTAGSAVVKQGTSKITVNFDKTYDYIPQVNTTLVAQGTPAQKQALLNQDYSVAVTDVTEDGFTIILNKNAATDVKLSWIAIQSQ